MRNRELKLIETLTGNYVEFIKYPIMGNPHKVKYLVTPDEVTYIKELLSKNNPYDIDNFLYSIG